MRMKSMRNLKLKLVQAALAVCGLTAALSGAAAQSQAAANDGRWKESFDAFAAADEARMPTPGGVVFVGSSSIRLWGDLEKDFAGPTAVTKRGFGGSRMLDCAQHLHELVVRYKPRTVVVYAGDNDLAEGRLPQEVLASFKEFVEGVRRQLPDARIAYLSIKPSPLREALMPEVRKTNALIEAYSEANANLDFIDVHTHMLNVEGRPRPEFFLPDRLHLNARGYALWKSVIAEHLR